MSSNFDPSKVGQRGGDTPRSTGPTSERLFLVVHDYETPADGFHYAVGHRAGQPDEVIKVRMNTVQERSVDRPKENVEKIKEQYLTGKNTRDSIADKAKAGIKLLSFDDARCLGRGESGITEYRAHWAKTMSTSPSAEVMAGMAHVRLKEATEYNGQRKPAQAYVEMMRSSLMADSDNIDQALFNALTTKDDQGRARDPLLILRVVYEGEVISSPRLYPAREPSKFFDQNSGEFREVLKSVDADKTVSNLMSGNPSKSDIENLQLDTIRAVVSGIKGLDEPVFNFNKENVVNDLRNIYYGIKEGAIQVEVIAAEKIDFGSDSSKTYLNDKSRPHLQVYSLKEQISDSQIRETAMYTDTVIAIHRHNDGEPYAVFASPEKMYPEVTKLVDLPKNPAPEPDFAAKKEMDADNAPSI